MSPNSKFADIEGIHKAQIEASDIEAISIEDNLSELSNDLESCIIAQ